MKVEIPGWMKQGAGESPGQVLSFRAESKITAFAGMLECGDYVIADNLGTLYRLDPLLNVTLITRIQGVVTAMAWSGTGEFGVAVLGPQTLVGLNEKLKVLWSINLPFSVSTLAINPYGTHLLVGSIDRGATLYNEKGKRIARFDTPRPLTCAEFLIDEPLVVAAAEHGLLAAYSMNGGVMWEERLWSNVGDLSIIQKLHLICLASHNHGIQVYNHLGESAATLVLEGTVTRISSSYDASQILISTIENHVYRVNPDGDLLWAAQSPVLIQDVDSHPLGETGVVILEDTALRLEWSEDVKSNPFLD